LRRGERTYFGKFEHLVARCLKELKASKIGYDGISPELLQKIRDTYDAEYLKLPDLVWDLRKIKTKKEIKLLQKSAELAEKGMKRVAELIEKGRSEIEIAAEAEYAMRRAGSERAPFNTIVASGKNSWLPHAGATNKRLRRGELITVDLGATYRGYASDMTRTFAIAPTRKQRELLRVVKRAQNVAIKRVRSGANATDIDRAARKVFKREGYERFCLHGTGHGVGLNIHEPPSLSPESKDVLRKGMVTTVEPGAYVHGIGGARWEDMVLVTARSSKLLTTFDENF
jgi:Xaa-Pro aminopeptidase